jgi:hypothetical protein
MESPPKDKSSSINIINEDGDEQLIQNKNFLTEKKNSSNIETINSSEEISSKTTEEEIIKENDNNNNNIINQNELDLFKSNSYEFSNIIKLKKEKTPPQLLDEHWFFEKILLDYNIIDFTCK